MWTINGIVINIEKISLERSFMEKEYNFIDCTKRFLREYSLIVKENTLKRYENDLTLFYLYLERFGPQDVSGLTWEHIEEFFSWWYLRQYMGCSLTGAWVFCNP